jgi:hypothetical protein
MIRAIKVPEPELEKLATLAAIGESPYEVIYLPGGKILPTTTFKKFRVTIITHIEMAHYFAAFENATTLKMKKIGSLARELKRALGASNEQYLSQLLPSPVEHYIFALDDLAKAAQGIGRRKKAKMTDEELMREVEKKARELGLIVQPLNKVH